jgi:arylsulfatase A-like enzyme
MASAVIVVDPSREADGTRGLTSDALVEAVDVVPTIVDYFGGTAVPHVVEGHSLLPILHA